MTVGTSLRATETVSQLDSLLGQLCSDDLVRDLDLFLVLPMQPIIPAGPSTRSIWLLLFPTPPPFVDPMSED